MAGKSILFVLGALSMGGVETYVVRLSRELVAQGHRIEILLLSRKINEGLRSQLSGIAELVTIERYPYLPASSWLNGMSLLSKEMGPYDIVHVVDLLTLGFVYFNRDRIRFNGLSIGIYHSAEVEWWRGRGVYFRDGQFEIYSKNIGLNLFSNEIMARNVAVNFGGESGELKVLPIGVDLDRYREVVPGFSSRRIVSVGRLVPFKKYNRHVISSLASLRLTGDYHYFVYGDGPELESLRCLAEENSVAEFVHFEGVIDYQKLPEVFDGAFCFVGSGTSIIEASAAGLPSVIGIESLNEAKTCGYFGDIEGYSYNEAAATNVRIDMVEVISALGNLSEDEYKKVSSQHREKASQFDIRSTSRLFVKLSSHRPDFRLNISRAKSFLSFVWALVRLGPSSLKGRFEQKV